MEHCPLAWRERGRLWMRLGIRAALAVAVGLLVMYGVPPLFTLLAPFVLAVVVAWLLNPPVRWLQRRLSLSRKFLSTLLLVLILCSVGGMLYGLARLALSQARSLLENGQALLDEGQAVAERISGWVDKLGRLLPGEVRISGEELAQKVTQRIRGLDLPGRIAALAGRAPSLVSDLSGFAIGAVVFVMASCFITGDYPRLRFQFIDRLPADTRAFCATVRTLFVKAFGGYLKSQLFLSLGVFGILAVGFFVTGQPYSLLLAAGLAVLDFVPIVGAGTVMVPWALIDLLTGGWKRAVGLLAIWGLTVLFRQVAEPKILGDQTGLSPILSLVGIYVGMKLGGIPGMILGPMVLLVLLNLGKLGVFRPLAGDLRLAARDVMGLLREGRKG